LQDKIKYASLNLIENTVVFFLGYIIHVLYRDYWRRKENLGRIKSLNKSKDR
jgi:hypothetical protein